MSFNVRLTEVCVEGSTSFGGAAQSFTCESIAKKDEAIADSTTNREILLAIDVSSLLVFYMISDVVMSVYTNEASTGSPQETFSLIAGKPVIFRTGDTAIFAGDVTSVFVTTGSVGAGTLKIISGEDLP